jgi:uncharacterized protein (DUF2384 family)
MTAIGRQDIPLTPTEVQTFSDEGDRKRLTVVALKAFRRIADLWTLTGSESAALLGVSLSTWERAKRGAREGDLSQDQLTRVSALIGIFKGLHLLFADDMADRWPRLSNKGPLFNRATPIEAMIEGGIPCMIEVRRYIDAVRGGL